MSTATKREPRSAGSSTQSRGPAALHSSGVGQPRGTQALLYLGRCGRKQLLPLLAVVLQAPLPVLGPA